ncbi:MAG: AGE family epimerase/isomerase [Candidatus Helarchaeota archaeon]
MKKERKYLIIFISIGLIFIPAILLFPKKPSFYPIVYKKPNYYFDDLIKFTLNNLWDKDSRAFLKYQLANGNYDDVGLRTYASLNIWAYFAFKNASDYKNSPLYREKYAIPALEYVINNLLNKSYFGVYHWCYKNGSLPVTGHKYYNDSRNIYSTYQAWITLALLDFYHYTNNETYLNYANKTVDFLINKLWDPVNYGFYYNYFPNNESVYSDKYSWYQSWPLEALLKAYEVTNNQSYLYYINKTVDFLDKYFWDDIYGGFYSNSEINGSNVNTDKYLTNQAGIIISFLSAARILNNQSYITKYIEPTLNFTKYFLWNDSFGQFYSRTNSSGGNPYNLIITSEISVMIDAILKYTKDTGNYTYYNLTTIALNHLVNYMWDLTYYGFYKEFDYNSISEVTHDKWIQEQSYPLLIFSESSYDAIDSFSTINLGLLEYMVDYYNYINNLGLFFLIFMIISFASGIFISFLLILRYKNKITIWKKKKLSQKHATIKKLKAEKKKEKKTPKTKKKLVRRRIG